MQEVKIDIIVRSTDLDILGHVNNVKYLEYLEWGRIEWYERNGLHHHSGEGAIRTVVVQTLINYRKECVFGDRLVVVTTPERVGRSSFVLKQTIYNQNGDLCADAAVTSVTIDPATRKSVAVPEFLRSQFVSS